MKVERTSGAQGYLAQLAPRLLAYLRVLLGDRHEAEDVLQELFLRYLESGPAAGTADADRWLFRVARNLGLKAIRGNQRRQRREVIHGRQPVAEPDPADAAEHREDIARIQHCLDRLEPSLRELVYLKMVEELSYREIEEQTGVPRSTAALRVQEGLAVLTQCFQGD